MRKEVLLTLVIGAVMFTACDKDSLNMDTSRNEKVYAILPLTEQTTKTTINQNLQVVWNTGDAISLFTESGNSSFINNKGTISGGIGTTEATFVVENIEGTKVAAVYPYISTTTFDGTKASITMPTSYEYVENGIGGAPMAALINDQDANIAFQNAGALMGITVNNIPAGYKTATLTSLGAQALTGTCDIIFDDGDVPTLVPTAETTGKEITITFEAAETATNKTFFFPIPVQDYESLSISISNGEDTKIMKTSGLNARRSVRYKSTLTPDQVSIPVASADELKAAITNAKAGATINLLANIDMENTILVIDKAITLDGNGKTLTSSAERAINVSGAEANGVTIKDLTISCTGERGINIIQNATDVTINNVTATADNYTVNVAGSAPEAIVTITGSTLTGKNVVNVGAVGADVTVSNSTLNCEDDDTSASGNFAALCLNKDATGASITATEGITINVTNGSDSVEARNDAEGGTITTTYDVVQTVAVIPNGDYYADYTTLQAAIDAATSGQTVKLIRDITASEIITINKAITLDGNDKKLTSTAGRAINVSGAEANDVTIQNLTIKCTGERGINIIQGATNVTIKNVTATAANYTVNVAGSAPEAIVTITGSTLTGKNVVNVGAVDADVTVSNSTLNCEDDDTNASGNFAALCLNEDATGGTITATGTTINVTNGSDSVPARNDAEGGNITIDGSSDNVVKSVAVIEHGDYYADYTTLQAAIDAATSGQTVKLIRDITASEIITINKAITLDGNDKKLTSTAGRAINVSGAEANGVTIQNLTIECTGERGINIIQYATNVTIDNVTIDADNYAVNIAGSAPNAEVTIKNSDLTGLNVVNVGGVEAQVTVTNTKLTNDNTAENDDNQYAILCLNKDATGGSSIAATGCTFNCGTNTVKGRNDTADGKITINGTTTDVVETVAYIDNGTYYKPRATFKEIVEVAKAGNTIKLIRDITASEVILIDKNITIDGNGKTITSSANRVFRLNTTGINVTMKNLNIVSTAVREGSDDIRGISFDGIGGMNLTLNNCSVDFTDDSANAYAWGVNMTGSNPGVNTLTIKGGTYEGANAININGNRHTISIDGATLTSLYKYDANHTGACVAIAGTGNTLTVKNSTFNGNHAVGIKERIDGETSYVDTNTITQEKNTDNTPNQTQPAS